MAPEGKHIHPDKGLSRARGLPVAGERLRTLRQARHWSQRIAAERAGVSDRLIRRAENGGLLEQKSLELLAELYSTPEQPLAADDLIASAPPPRGEAADARRHEKLLRRWFDEVWNQGRLAAIDELAAPDCVLHAEGLTFRGPAQIRKRAEAIRTGFSNFHVEFDEIAAQRDLVIGRWRMRMTNTGVWMGLPPTKKRLVIHGSTWMRIHNGRISERWDCWDLSYRLAVLTPRSAGGYTAAQHETKRKSSKSEQLKAYKKGR
ncbi:MAG: ester cyclase [Pirellulales bacterium]